MRRENHRAREGGDAELISESGKLKAESGSKLVLLPTLGGQTALNTAMALHRIRRAGKTRHRNDWRQGRGHPQRRRPPGVQGSDALHRPRRADQRHRAQHGRSPRRRRKDRPVPAHHPARVHARRHRRRHRLQPRRIRRPRQARHGALARHRNPHRRIPARLEGIRNGGHARQGRQLRHHLLHRKLRPDGRPHRRLHHRRAHPDADGQGIPDHARRRASP